MYSIKKLPIILLSCFVISCSSEDEPAVVEPRVSDVLFYTDQQWNCGTISVTLDDEAPQTITQIFSNGAPNCDSGPEVLFQDVTVGEHSFTAESIQGCQWEGSFRINVENVCIRVVIDSTSFTGNVCNFEADLECIEFLRTDTIAFNCGLTNSARLAYHFRNNCEDKLLILGCRQDGFIMQPDKFVQNADGLNPGEEDFFESCDGFPPFTMYSVPFDSYLRYDCVFPACP